MSTSRSFDSDHPIGATRLTVAIPLGLTLLATVSLYWPALGVGFLGDDFMILHRLRGLEHAADVERFFRGEFFEYYRPLGFVSHALDWFIAGQDAREFHRTNLLIHVVNTILLFLVGRSLSARPLAGLLAGALFALHSSNSEAVVWISARFDLLATCFGLAALFCMMRARVVGQPGAVALFFLALLSKEAAVALPIAAAGWAAFRLRATTWKTVAFVAPWLAALAAYSVLRHVAGGVSAVGGAARIPKLAAFMVCTAAVVGLSSDRWMQLREWLKPRRSRCAVVGIAALAFVVLAAALGSGKLGALMREKLAVAGFSTFYLVSPVLRTGEWVFNDPTSTVAGIVGACSLVTVGVVILVLWQRLLDDDRYWFLAALLTATLLPISALTEGKRYLYLPSAAVSLIVALVVVESHGRWRRIMLSIVALILAVSALQIVLRVQDWRWAGRMTADGAQLVDSTLAPSCGTGHVVFLTSPVGVRGVYSHFYYESFEVPRGCMPEVFQVVVRVVRIDSPIDVRWNGPDRIVITAPDYAGQFVLSHDLRTFDTPLRIGEAVSLETPLGAVSADASNHAARVTLTLSRDVLRAPIHFFYYADGRIQPLAPAPRVQQPALARPRDHRMTFSSPTFTPTTVPSSPTAKPSARTQVGDTSSSMR